MPRDRFAQSRLLVVVLARYSRYRDFFPVVFVEKRRKMQFSAIIPQTLLQHD